MIMSFEFQILQHTKLSAQKEHISKQETQSGPCFFSPSRTRCEYIKCPGKKKCNINVMNIQASHLGLVSGPLWLDKNPISSVPWLQLTYWTFIKVLN